MFARLFSYLYRPFSALARYPVLLRELARGGAHLRRTLAFLLLIACVSSVPALSYQVPGVPGWLVLLYIVLLPLSALLWVFLAALFVRHVLLPVLSYRAWFSDVYNLVLSLARHLLYAGVAAAAGAFLLSRFAPAADASFLAAALALFVLFDSVAHFAALGTRRYLWGAFALLAFLVLFAPAAWLFAGSVWAPGVFRLVTLSGEKARAVSVPDGSLVVVDGLFCSLHPLSRFEPVLYTGRGLGGEERSGRIFGLSDERLELDGGDVFNFDTGAVIAKPPALQERLWIPVAVEDFDGTRDTLGWRSTTADWLVRDGMLRVSPSGETSLVFAPRADARAWPQGVGVTDLEVVRSPSAVFRSPGGLPFHPLPANFKTDRTPSGRLRYWGVFPSAGAVFCPRCGASWPHPPVSGEPRKVCAQCGAPIPRGVEPPLFSLRGGENPVYDLRVSFTLTLRSRKGLLFLRYRYHDVPVAVRIDAAKGTVSITAQGSGSSAVLPVPLRLNSPLRISASFYDGVVELSGGGSFVVLPVEVDLAARPPFFLSFTASGGSFALDDLAVFRDQYYTPTHGLYAVGSHSLVKVPSGSFFLLSDRGQDTRDSRTFGCIDRRDVRGVPVFVLWPLVF